MRKIALLVIALSLLCWRPSPASTQPLPQAANFQDRDDHRDQDRDDHRDQDRDRRGDDHRDADRRGDDHRDADRDRHDDDRDHFRDRDHWDRDRFPRGSYVRSCRDIRLEGDTLRASCQRGDSRWRDTSFRHAASCRGELFNDNGRLRCR
jgi:Ni/Co efflux regulator RcnB